MSQRAPAAEALAPREACEIGVEAYLYVYPLGLMDLTRRQLTHIEAGKMFGRGPMNRFSHMLAFPPADFNPR